MQHSKENGRFTCEIYNSENPKQRLRAYEEY